MFNQEEGLKRNGIRQDDAAAISPDKSRGSCRRSPSLENLPVGIDGRLPLGITVPVTGNVTIDDILLICHYQIK